jgi:hypothetical protein
MPRHTKGSEGVVVRHLDTEQVGLPESVAKAARLRMIEDQRNIFEVLTTISSNLPPDHDPVISAADVVALIEPSIVNRDETTYIRAHTALEALTDAGVLTRIDYEEAPDGQVIPRYQLPVPIVDTPPEKRDF